MDHFALKNDDLAKAFNEGKLYRNFMGYTVKPADEYIGFGITSIGHNFKGSSLQVLNLSDCGSLEYIGNAFMVKS